MTRMQKLRYRFSRCAISGVQSIQLSELRDMVLFREIFDETIHCVVVMLS